MALEGVEPRPAAGGNLAVDDGAAVVAARGEEDAELRVRPRDLPDGALVAAARGKERGASERAS